MKNVPSLVASSTVGIAATGLALGRQEHTISLEPTLKSRKAGNDVYEQHMTLSRPTSRSALNSRVATPSLDISKGAARAFSFENASARATHSLPSSYDDRLNGLATSRSHGGDLSALKESVVEDGKASISSKSSWMLRRFSAVPGSHNNSPRSSVGPDSPSISFSHGSAAPILGSSTGSPAASVAPNKLVKRSTSDWSASGKALSRSGSRSQAPTLKRPATSNQRSATLQNQNTTGAAASEEKSDMAISQERSTRERGWGELSQENLTIWRPYFRAHPTKLGKDRPSATKSADGSFQSSVSLSLRVLPDNPASPTLMHASAVTKFDREDVFNSPEQRLGDGMGVRPATTTPATGSTGQDDREKRPRRSMSMNFGSPSAWVTRSTSLRLQKRIGGESHREKRVTSSPFSAIPGRRVTSAHEGHYSSRQESADLAQTRRYSVSTQGDETQAGYSYRSWRNASRTRETKSSPLPPFSRLSSFNVDMSGLEIGSSLDGDVSLTPSSPLNHLRNSTSTSPYNGSPAEASSPRDSSRLYNTKPLRLTSTSERGSTLVGSDSDNKVFFSGEDDDGEFGSDTVYDSYRTGATGSLRSSNPPLDTMFSDEPVSNPGNRKGLVLREVSTNTNLARVEASNKIVEEDETTSTPVRSRFSFKLETPIRGSSKISADGRFPSSPPSMHLGDTEFARLSLEDDDDDEDWTREDEPLGMSSLSPPSIAFNSRHAMLNSTVRNDLIGEPLATNASHVEDRRKGNLFEWSEQPTREAITGKQAESRPKTVHGKQIIDARGGRSVGRKGPSPVHVRSQSVPAAPDVNGQRDIGKKIHKFGTWGLGGKGVSEDWDNDFDFEGGDNEIADDLNGKSSTNAEMIVPPAIQASQANIKGHVGQIREICLLVEDLKRLRIQARERNLLDGDYAKLWKEAEGIIALAIPDDEDETLSPSVSPNPKQALHDSPQLSLKNSPFTIFDADGKSTGLKYDGLRIVDAQGRPTDLYYDGTNIRRYGVLSPDDDIFGTPADEPVWQTKTSRVHARGVDNKEKSDIFARSVMETMHMHRSNEASTVHSPPQLPRKMPFDTTSLKDLVQRASALSRKLAEVIRASESLATSAQGDRESSPAFTRVFSGPGPEQPSRLPRSRSSNSEVNGSLEGSPSPNLSQRMHMMTVV